uniref:Uncharacterized protein n=1 Tax=Glossina pallidipes TaxID=7398 RepID=A0A1B0AIN6_GLOPL
MGEVRRVRSLELRLEQRKLALMRLIRKSAEQSLFRVNIASRTQFSFKFVWCLSIKDIKHYLLTARVAQNIRPFTEAKSGRQLYKTCWINANAPENFKNTDYKDPTGIIIFVAVFYVLLHLSHFIEPNTTYYFTDPYNTAWVDKMKTPELNIKN